MINIRIISLFVVLLFSTYRENLTLSIGVNLDAMVCFSFVFSIFIFKILWLGGKHMVQIAIRKGQTCKQIEYQVINILELNYLDFWAADLADY